MSNTEKMKESILKFEEKRLNDVKKHLQDSFYYFRSHREIRFANFWKLVRENRKNLQQEYCRLEMTFAAKCLEQWSRCYQDLQNINPGEDLLTFEQLVAPQRLMANLGYNRNEREQGLVSQLQNTSLTQERIELRLSFNCKSWIVWRGAVVGKTHPTLDFLVSVKIQFIIPWKPKSMQQQTSSFVSNFSAKSQNISYGTPSASARTQKTNSSAHSR